MSAHISGSDQASAKLKSLPTLDVVEKRNFWAHGVEGGLFMGGMAFVAVNTILPRLADRLGAPSWLISLTPVLLLIGFSLPTLFTAHIVERLERVMPLLMIMGIVQRIPYLIAGLILFFLPLPTLALWVVVLTPFFSGFAGGLIVTAWQELVAKTVRINRRSTIFAVRNIISAIIGLGAGVVVIRVLERFPGIRGYGVLHLICFASLVLSYVVFAAIRETHSLPRDPALHCSLSDNLREMPSIAFSDIVFRRYLISRIMVNGMYIMMPFLPLHILRVTGRPDSFLGTLLLAQMIGGIGGNLFAAYIGDRYGSKPVMMVGRLTMLGVCLGMLFAGSVPHFLLLNVLLGFADLSIKIGAQTISIEISPFQKRATYLALISFVGVPSMLVSSLLGALLWDWKGHFGWLAVATILALIISTIVLILIPDPRRCHPAMSPNSAGA